MDTAFSESVASSLRALRLCGYDWDGAGGLPMRDDVADTAIGVFVDPKILGDYAYAMPLPSISLSSNGTVEAAFAEPDGKQLFLTFQCDGVITFIRAFEDGQTSVEGIIRVDTLDATPDDYAELTALFAWFASEE